MKPLSVFAPLICTIEDHPGASVLVFVGVFTILRLALLFFYQSDLGPDEAQYWFWGQSFDWGYYSKPPMIAWVIGLPTAIFGDYEWSVRFLSPMLIGATSLFLFSAGQRLFGDRIGIWAAVLWQFLPAVMFGATIVSTDVPLLFFWSLALLGLVGMTEALDEKAATSWAVVLGVALGFGFLSKYAMIYFPLGWAVAMVISPYARRSWRGGRAMIAIVLAGVIFSPNLWWNANNGFQTLGHTADNANWGGNLLNFDELLRFVGDQFGVAGPFLFGALLIGFFGWRWRSGSATLSKEVMLVCFILPPLVIISIQALISRAHANWAMAAYPAAMILVPVWLGQMRARWALWASVGLHAIAGLFVTIILLNFELADSLGRSNDIKRVRGWNETVAQIASAAEGFDAVVVDEREIGAHLVWVMRGAPFPLAMADLNARQDNTYEHAFPFSPDAAGRYLLATQVPDVVCAYRAFATIEPAGSSFVDLKASRRGRPERTIDLYRLSGFDPDRAALDCD